MYWKDTTCDISFLLKVYFPWLPLNLTVWFLVGFTGLEWMKVDKHPSRSFLHEWVGESETLFPFCSWRTWKHSLHSLKLVLRRWVKNFSFFIYSFLFFFSFFLLRNQRYRVHYWSNTRWIVIIMGKLKNHLDLLKPESKWIIICRASMWM